MQIGTVVVLLSYGLIYMPAMAQSVARKPVLIDTDIGADINDAFALGLAFGDSAVSEG